MRRAVFLDRDGVINAAVVRGGKPYPPATAEELEILPGVPDALRQLKAAGFLLIVATNQPDVARGSASRDGVERIHAALARELPIDEFAVCYHDDADACDCRKPQPGLLLRAAQRRDIELGASFMVGDRWRDIEAGHAAGCSTVFLDYGYAERQPTHVHCRVKSLIDAIPFILSPSHSL